jgi:hypothetical protein
MLQNNGGMEMTAAPWLNPTDQAQPSRIVTLHLDFEGERRLVVPQLAMLEEAR